MLKYVSTRGDQYTMTEAEKGSERTPEERHDANSQDAQGRRHERKVDELSRGEDHPRDIYEHR